MKTIIFFREGLSGHYLKSIIDDRVTPVNFRMDPWYPNAPTNSFRHEQCICVHKNLVDYKTLAQQYELVLTIQVRKKIYQAIYNNFYKKFLVENPDLQQDFNQWQSNMFTWYDRTFYNIKEYYQLYQQDLVDNMFSNIVEFDQLLDLDYVEQLLMHYYHRPITQNIQYIVNTYSKLQLTHDLSGDECTMQDIVEALPDQVFLQSPWFASYCIFKYEINNGLQESQRQWSINLATRPIDKEFLLSIAQQYQL